MNMLPEYLVYINPNGRDKVGRRAILICEASNAKSVSYVGMSGGKIDVIKSPAAKFKELYLPAAWGKEAFKPEWAAADTLLGTQPKAITSAALDHLERMMNMDTRGKSTQQIRDEIARISVELPQGHPLRAVPEGYPDRGTAIAAYTNVRQAIFHSTQPKEQSNMVTKSTAAPAAAGATAAPAADPKAAEKAKKEAEAAAKKEAAEKAKKEAAEKKAAEKAAADAKKLADKAAKKKAADLTGNYIADGQALKVKTTEELGMHEDSVRTKVLAAVMASKAKNGVDYAKLEAVAGDKTRGAVAYLIKKGFLKKVAATA
jgi:hypothetical protein